ncbi:MAG: M4 family metallopeptidase, partial [Bacteroidota bacterium]
MKRIILSILAILIIPCYVFSQEFQGKEADRIIPGSAKLRYYQHTDVPAYVEFSKGKEPLFTGAESCLGLFLKNSQEAGMVLKDESSDRLGMKHYRYQPTWNGIPVEFSSYLVHVKDGKIISMNGDFPDAVKTNMNWALTSGEALEKARQYVDAETYKWEIPGEEDFLKRETGDPNASFYPDAIKVILPEKVNSKSTEYRAAYKFDIYSHFPLMRQDVYVDATTGEILFTNKTIHVADATGTAITGHSGQQTIVSDSYGGTYRLRETGRGNGIQTYDMNMTTDYGSAVDFTDTDNYWDNANAELDEYATDAHWAAEMTYDYYFNEHGRNSIDGNGFALRSYIHFNLEAMGYPNNVNAFWDGSRMSYGDGNGTTISPLTTVDICGHEITHGLTSYTADLTYQDESGALNEGFSDIFGTMVEFYAKPGLANWTIGEDIGATFRSLADPNAYSLPDTYLGNYWHYDASDNGGVHTNCGVLMYWFYLVSEGGSGTNDNGDAYNITGIGKGNTDDIAFRMLTVYLTNGSDYSDARYYAIQSAIDLYGPCTPEVEAVTNAMYAVGVGNAYVPYVVSDFEADITQACAAPFTVNFNNMSVNGTSFNWDFGDSGTSTAFSPSHTYSALGTYTVTLAADGGVCGNDTEIKTSYIVVDTTLPCIAFMPVSGSYTHYGCTGKLYDPGGPASNYNDDSDVTFTISPTGASQVTLTFISFAIEAGSGSYCDYDYLAIYDGPTTAAQLINDTYYCNTTGSPGTITSTGGSITIRLHSDQAVTLAGFELDWSCSFPTSPPVANFSSDVTTTCNGTVAFSDLSTNGPISWLWNFGDGNTSTQQNPVHTYITSGSYTVSLTATNPNGSDTYTLSGTIDVTLPTAPVVTGDTICENTSASLSATGTGTIYWYSVPTGGSPVTTGNSYTTPLLATTTTWWVENVIEQPVQNVGETDNTVNGGFL